ncbi:MAG: methyltransferase domain-containing protein [Bacteroidetes bacterium]|jgi:SAM-dependent methyltransferase|nr:methyltransferase domain-containing protein [Bacteroidota bacterium]
MSWFKEWFDSPLYEKLYAYRNKNEANKLADLIEREIPASKYRNVLDLGCGRGRHSITLAERGYKVLGIDISKEVIAKAAQIAGEKDLPNLQFQVGDMRRPLDKTFDAVVNLFTTFGYFLKDEENAKVLSSVNSMLHVNGIFILDYLNAYKVRRDLVAEEEELFRDMTVHIERKIKRNMVYKKIRFTGDKLEQPIQYQERVKLYELDWFKKTFNRNGFQLERCYGSYEGADFEKVESPRLLMVARKL